jgi:hypothetical protein
MGDLTDEDAGADFFETGTEALIVFGFAAAAAMLGLIDGLADTAAFVGGFAAVALAVDFFCIEGLAEDDDDEVDSKVSSMEFEAKDVCEAERDIEFAAFPPNL